MSRIPIKVPLNRNEALWLFQAHGIEALRDQARIDPNPNGAAALLLDDIKEKEETTRWLQSFRTPRLAPAKPTTLMDLRRSGHTHLKITCTRCWHESHVRIADIPRSPARDNWPMNMLRYTHDKCPATGTGAIRWVGIKGEPP